MPLLALPFEPDMAARRYGLGGKVTHIGQWVRKV
jgi:hypothetical protein